MNICFDHMLYRTALFVCLLSTQTAYATIQLADTFYFDGKHYDLIERNGVLPTPRDYGMEPQGTHTAYYRGYCSEYKIEESLLLLSRITINTRNERYLPINGVSADGPARKCSNAETMNSSCCLADGRVYSELNLPVQLNGAVRIVRKLMRDYWFPLREAWQYEVVVDLRFKNGQLVEKIDRSNEAKHIRGEFIKFIDAQTSELNDEIMFSLQMTPLR